jgi:hypothetical protein
VAAPRTKDGSLEIATDRVEADDHIRRHRHAVAIPEELDRKFILILNSGRPVGKIHSDMVIGVYCIQGGQYGQAEQ